MSHVCHTHCWTCVPFTVTVPLFAHVLGTGTSGWLGAWLGAIVVDAVGAIVVVLATGAVGAIDGVLVGAAVGVVVGAAVVDALPAAFMPRVSARVCEKKKVTAVRVSVLMCVEMAT
jgi:hypothetical protein